MSCYVLLCVLMCCNVLLCIVMCCNVLLCVVMCCRVLHALDHLSYLHKTDLRILTKSITV
jgi:hypothetical protein